MAGYHRAACRWMQTLKWRGGGAAADALELRRFLEPATLRQLLGFPAPGDEYWNEETVAGVAARYPEMDLAPYAEAVCVRQVPHA